jgi:hypothetical protein
MTAAAPPENRFFRDAFGAAPEPPITDDAKPALLVGIKAKAAAILKSQGMYQPLYVLEADYDKSPREAHLIENCEFVKRHFGGIPKKHQVRILDVGCNNGFVSFHLAETFQQVIGFDINPAYIALCKDLATYTGSRARFFQADLLKMVEAGGVDLVNIDCVLLFNVVHQLIFAFGMEYVKLFLARLSRSVDVIFVELATRADYKPHGKDHLLPIDPEEIFSECVGCRKTPLRRSQRTLYKMERTSVSVEQVTLTPMTIRFSGNNDPGISRKYYKGTKAFLKQFRWTPRQGPTSFRAEVGALLKVRDQDIAPRIIDWSEDASSGSIVMETVYGLPLHATYGAKGTDVDKVRVVSEMIRIAAVIHRNGFYQNDFSAHNFLIRSDGSLILLDFEQSQTYPAHDTFAFLLWIINDLHKGETESYKKGVYRKLGTKRKPDRAPREFYPDTASIPDLSPSLRDLIKDAEEAADWGAFVTKWDRKLLT